MKCLVKLVPIVFVFASFNADAVDYFWDAIVGLTVKQVSLDVFEEGETDPAGILIDDLSFFPEFGVESNINYFPDSSWGYKFVVNLAGFDISKQEVDLDDVDLDTSADGYFFYAMPVGLYDFHKQNADSSLLVGIGVGIGYLNAEGDIILTELDTPVRQDFDFSELTYSTGVFFQYIVEGWSFSTSVAGPEVSDDDFDYNLFDLTFSVRKTIPL